MLAGVGRFGSAALGLAWVAAGRYDAYWEPDLNPWDLAAGVLLVTEAGGRVTDAAGEADVLAAGSVCAGDLDIQPQLPQRSEECRVGHECGRTGRTRCTPYY